MNNKVRIQYKNIAITYNKCYNISLNVVIAFFIDLFKNIYKTNEINYLLVSYDKKNKLLLCLLILNKKPNFKIIDKFIFENKEPIFESVPAPQDFITEIKNDKDYEYLEYGFFENIKVVKKDEENEKEDFYNFLDSLRAEYITNKEMTTEQAEKRIHEFLDEKKNSMRYSSTSTIRKVLEVYFTRNINPVEKFFIFPLESFKNDNLDIINIKREIDNQIEKLRQPNGRPYAIVIEGKTRIGKTEFIMSYCKYKGIKFNSMKIDFNFSRKYYFDDCEIDICDDINLFTIKKQELIEAMCSCAQKNVKVETQKYEKDRTLKNNHLTIFLCNAHSSFETHIDEMKKENPELASYLRDNLIFIKINSTQNLYKEAEK